MPTPLPITAPFIEPVGQVLSGGPVSYLVGWYVGQGTPTQDLTVVASTALNQPLGGATVAFMRAQGLLFTAT